jgi:PAP2 superfamily
MGMADPHGVTSLINQYAAMPSLHVGWAIWCAAAVVATTHSRWRHLAWLYPAATTFVVMATANHYLLDALAGAVLMAACLAVTYRVRGKPRSTVEVAGSGQRDVTTLPRV